MSKKHVKGHLGCIRDTSASSSPSIKTILLFRLQAISVVCRVKDFVSSQTFVIYLIFTVVTMQRVTDPVVVAVCAKGSSENVEDPCTYVHIRPSIHVLCVCGNKKSI